MNGGYYQEFLPQVFQEIIENYHPDGFADNSWAGMKRTDICYCENCRKKFREEYRMELPEKRRLGRSGLPEVGALELSAEDPELAFL